MVGIYIIHKSYVAILNLPHGRGLIFNCDCGISWSYFLDSICDNRGKSKRWPSACNTMQCVRVLFFQE